MLVWLLFVVGAFAVCCALFGVCCALFDVSCLLIAV